MVDSIILRHILLHVLILTSESTANTVAEDDYTYLYGKGIFDAQNHVLLQSSANRLPEEVQMVVIYFGPGLTNTVRIQLWNQIYGINYTLDWETKINPPGGTGRTLIELSEDEFFRPSILHRIGLYCEVDPCPILYDFLPGVDTVTSLDSFPSGDHVPLQTTTLFESLFLPLVFAVGLCAGKDCDVLPTPTTSPIPSTTVQTPQYQEKIVLVTEEPSDLLNESVILGVLIWLIILSFMFISMIFLLICLFLRPKHKDHRQNTNTGDWIVVLEKNGANKEKPAKQRLSSIESTSRDSI